MHRQHLAAAAQVDTLTSRLREMEGVAQQCEELRGALQRADMARAQAEERVRRCGTSRARWREAVAAGALWPQGCRHM